MTKKQFTIAGEAAAAAAQGLIFDWSGRGAGTALRPQIVNWVRAANLPESCAPTTKSAKRYLHKAVKSLNNSEYRSEAPKSDNKPTSADRGYRAKWQVHRIAGVSARVGDSAGPIVLTVELPVGTDDLKFEGDQQLAAAIQSHYAAAMSTERYEAGDITKWLANLLRDRFRAAEYLGWYVPNRHADSAKQLCATVSQEWGTKWALGLPVATNPELRRGVAQGFFDEIKRVAEDLKAERVKTTKANKVEISPTVAGRFLKDLAEIDGRAAGYKILCGADALADAATQLQALKDDLGKIATDGVMRFSLLEMDRPKARWAESDAKVAPAVKAADAATASRHAVKAMERKPATPEAIKAPQPTTAAPVTTQDTRRAESLERFRDQFRQERDRSGANAKDFKRACLVYLNDPATATPQEWLKAAESVNAPPINPAIADRASMLEFD